MKGATIRKHLVGWRPEFQSTRPVKGATSDAPLAVTLMHVSIHAPREGRDVNVRVQGEREHWFQSTRPVKGATWLQAAHEKLTALFQSTRPVKGATARSQGRGAGHAGFNPRAP